MDSFLGNLWWTLLVGVLGFITGTLVGQTVLAKFTGLFKSKDSQ